MTRGLDLQKGIVEIMGREMLPIQLRFKQYFMRKVTYSKRDGRKLNKTQCLSQFSDNIENWNSSRRLTRFQAAVQLEAGRNPDSLFVHIFCR